MCYTHKNLKQALNRRFISEKVHRVIKFNQNNWLKPYIDMNTDLRKKAKSYVEKDFFKSLNDKCCFWKNYAKCEKT